MTALTVADLRPVDLFDDLDDNALAAWVAVAQRRDVPADEIVAAQGADPVGFLLLLEGTMRTFVTEGERLEPVGHQEAPTWVGAISVLTGGTLGVTLRAATPCRMAVVAPEDFERLVLSQPAVHRRIMGQVSPVLSRLTAMEQSRERLASLGEMAAGLAHELNNPAAAARRAASEVTEAVDVVSSTLRRFVDAGIEREVALQLAILQQEAVDAAASQTALDALDAADAEDALRDRLDDLGVAEAWRLAEPLAAAGLDEAWLDRVVEHAGPALDAALAWVAATLTAHSLAADLQESTARMSSLVGAVKSYAYMDRGELVEIDLHEGLETTLAVLGHKLKHTSIEVRREYDRALPRLMVRGSELNQVWTNLLDNAIDAVGERGTITITTRRDGDRAVVEIRDDGAGVPDDVRERIFDAFVTSKDVGQGTGLGLATARRIVVDRHDGSIAFDSRPGETTFRVSLPFTQT